MSRYPIPKERTRIELRISNSRFIATVAPASTMRDAQDFLREIRAEMPDATHHVYAFKIGYGASVAEGMSDDGEPSGTAGPPTLAVLRGAELGDVALVTTRYFGGTKLGTGGLVHAYTSAAQAVLKALPVVEKVDRVAYTVEIPYPLLERVRRLLPDFECLLDDEQYTDVVTLQIRLPGERASGFEHALTDLSAGQIQPRRDSAST